jgi:hypothetical protein
MVLPIKFSSLIVGGNCDFVTHNKRWQFFFGVYTLGDDDVPLGLHNK